MSRHCPQAKLCYPERSPLPGTELSCFSSVLSENVNSFSSFFFSSSSLSPVATPGYSSGWYQGQAGQVAGKTNPQEENKNYILPYSATECGTRGSAAAAGALRQNKLLQGGFGRNFISTENWEWFLTKAGDAGGQHPAMSSTQTGTTPTNTTREGLEGRSCHALPTPVPCCAFTLWQFLG